MLDDSQKTRIDVDVLDETTLTKTIDEYLHIKSPLEKDLELKDSKNVWYPDDVGFIQADSFTGYDTLVFDMNFPELLYKVVNGVHISFTMSTDKTVLVEKVGIVGLINSYTNVDFAVKGTSDVDVTVDLSEVNNDELISLLGESKLFIFVDLKCDLDIASINIMNPKVDVAFTKELYDEVLSVSNRVTGSLDFYLEGDEIILQIGDETKYPIKVGDLLGSNYYHYNLHCNNYSPSTNESLTVTCKVTNIFGDVVVGKSLNLYYKGSVQGSATTNEEGIATWTINTGSVGGTFKVSVNDTYNFITVTYDTGWVLGSTFMNSHMPSYDSTTTIRVRRIGNIVHFEGIATNENALGGDASGTKIGTLPSEFRPSKAQRFVQQGSGMNRYLLVFQASGDIYLQRYGTTSMITVPINSWLNMYATWMIK